MADLFKGRHHSAWSVCDQVDVLRPSLECRGNSSASSSCSGSPASSSSSCCDKSRRSSLRHSNHQVIERKAYPLPHPMQFEKLSAVSPSSDPRNDICRPMQSFMRSTDKGRQKPRVEDDSANSPSEQPWAAAMEQPTSSIHVTDKHPSPSPRDRFEQAGILERSSGNSAERDALGFLQEHDVAVKKAEEVEEAGSRLKAPRKVVVVYDGEKKFTSAPLDIAIKGYATSEGDAIVVVAFLEHILSPMGMKMAADMEHFGCVNDAVLEHGVSSKKMEIESKLRASCRLQLCQMKKIHLDVKVLPGSNSKALVAKEILALQATSVIFDKNAMKNRKYYEENLSCHVLRLRSDGRRVETVSLFGQLFEKAGSLKSYCSDSSSGSLSSEPACNSPSIWSKLNIFVSKSSTGQFRHSHGGQASIVSSSRTSSESGSPRPVLQEEDETTVAEEALEESFSFDTPKPASAGALPKPASAGALPKPASAGALPKPASAGALPKPASAGALPKPASAGALPKPASAGALPKPASAEALEESFSFDTPKPSTTHEAYVYAAAGLDDYSLYRRRNRGAFSTALVA